VSFSVSSLLAGFVFGVIGMFLIGRARREGHLPSLLVGIVLVLYPYFIENVYLLWGAGIALVALAYKTRS
jgi:hypothetical protein